MRCAARDWPRRGPARDARSAKQLGESGFGGLGDSVQLDVHLDMVLVAKLSNFSLKLGYPAAESSDLEYESLLAHGADVSHEGACHMATLHFP